MISKKPRTSSEAKQMIGIAVEEGNYLYAKEIYDELEMIENFENEKELSKKVHLYLQNKEIKSKKYSKSTINHENELIYAKNEVERIYYNQFVALKHKQEIEYQELTEEWDYARNSKAFIDQKIHKTGLLSAKILAESHQYQTAFNLKKQLEKEFSTNTYSNQHEIDLKYKNKCNLMIQRHQQEIMLLAQQKGSELEIISTMKKAANSHALENFFVDNSNAVFQIMKRFPPDSKIPISLKMQITKAKPR